MEQKIDELLRQLHKYLFADSDQVVNELRIYLMDDSLKEADLGKNKFVIYALIKRFCLQRSLTPRRASLNFCGKIYSSMID